MQRLNTMLGVMTLILSLYVAAAWWRIWRHDAAQRSRNLRRKTELIERPAAPGMQAANKRWMPGRDRNHSGR
jgi:hypothetical protein